MNAQLKELQNKSEIQILALENQLSAFQKTLLETLSTINNKIIPPKFELILSRYFYIEHDYKKTWDEAAEACRGTGGYLAAFKTQEELAAIMQKLKKRVWYWTGVRHSKEGGKFISTASGKPATVFKWFEGEPRNDGACVFLDDLGMRDLNCSSERSFICQLDNET
ncbi:C-type lectin 37Db-like [Drosophila takahashii]|uniref:C-type lectin 37Db-like n=1 Tax=Drosophila takahashii TaxID=29030 RepID=UPI001CF8E4E1|nr:hemolymph lipopolysaccharide-binding protein-like [Drosophila takahashii]